MNPTTLSKFVKAMRKQYNLTQVELSEKSGVGLRFVRIFHDGFPRSQGIRCRLARFTPQVGQLAAHIRIFYAQRTVHIPGKGSSSRTAARFKVWHVRAGFRIVVILIFPSNNTVFNKYIPAARAGAIHAVRGAYHFVVGPTIAVHVFPFTAAFKGLRMTVCAGFLRRHILIFLKDTFHPYVPPYGIFSIPNGNGGHGDVSHKAFVRYTFLS